MITRSGGTTPEHNDRVLQELPRSVNVNNTNSQCATPVQYFKQKLEQQLKRRIQDENQNSFLNKTSPTLDKLRDTPGRVFRDRQQLISKHEKVKEKADALNIGGGIAMWPEMEKMRLTRDDMVQIACMVICILLTIPAIFYRVHGHVIHKLLEYHQQLQDFHQRYPISFESQESFNLSVLKWHKEYRILLDKIHASFDVSQFPTTYIMYFIPYMVGMGTLVYYLYDNMFSNSKLSPRRIKRWVSLLCIISLWTLALVYFLACGYMVELDLQKNVHLLGEIYGDVISKGFNLDLIHSVLSYWRTRCLPPTSMGTVSIMGVLALQDVIHYLQYYSIPVITVLFTPVIQLIVSLYSMYAPDNIHSHPN